ncbi:MAG: glutamine synthetase [Eubacterium sp.]|nr:glutamine synthetase [Eubacterium sp.]
MAKNKDDVYRYVRENKIRSVRLAFCDVFGWEKSISITPEEVLEAFQYGVTINARDVKNFGENIYTDLVLHPLPETMAELPHMAEDDRMVRMFCSMTLPDGTPFLQRGTKSLLKKAMDIAEVSGFEFYFGTELEYYLLKTDENGQPVDTPQDMAGYLDVPPDDKCDGIRRGITRTLERMDVKPSNMFHQRGWGQNEIDFSFSNPINAGDNITTAKTMIKVSADRNNLYADFSPTTYDNHPGNSCHITFSVQSSDGRTDNLHHAVAGVLDKIAEMTVFFNPTEESYNRLGKFGAPKYVSWSGENRSQLMRIPQTVGHFHKAELRSADAAMNPYLAFALIIHASLYGIKNQLPLPEEADFDFDAADNETIAKYKTLPQSLEEARELARNSEFVKSVVPKEIIEIYC